MEESERLGIEALKYFSSLAGKSEEVSKLLWGWRSMTPVQRQSMLDAYKIMKSIPRDQNEQSK